jgi:peptidoglycan-N-acetylglucosamine deacetylase
VVGTVLSKGPPVAKCLQSLLAVGLALVAATSAARASCQSPGQAGGQQGLGVARIVQIDASTGPLYGDITKFQRQASFLKPKEVVLTFDDGPLPWITKSILDTLERFCTKATFFSVGRMAMAYPETLREIMAKGHTLGTHTWSHPMNMRRLPIEQSTAEIERGFAAVAAAAGQPIAPFFRFPGLGDSGPMLSHLQRRNVATFTVDVVSNDSYIPSVERLTRETLAKVEQHNGGIMLFHDIKAVTAKALPGILAELQRRGYRVAHMTSKHAFVPDLRYAAEYTAQLAKLDAQRGPKKPLPFYGAVGPDRIAKETGASLVAVAPAAANYAGAAPAAPRVTRDKGGRAVVAVVPEVSAWSTTVRKAQKLRTAPRLGSE